MGPVQALVTARLAEGTIGDNGFAGGIPPAGKNKAPEMIVVITGAPGGDWQHITTGNPCCRRGTRGARTAPGPVFPAFRRPA